jgi:hypothetical protein
MNLKVNTKQTLTDSEDELISLEARLNSLLDEYPLPKGFYLPSEWSTFIAKKTALTRRLRKLQAEICDNTSVAD